MHVTAEGIELIKKYEGLRLKAYKALSAEKYYTIGYGHYGPDVKMDMQISKAQADAFLAADILKVEKAINKYNYNLNQNQYNALASFTFNCGTANLKKITDNGKRTLAQISARIPNYCTASGMILQGLKRRRKEEKELFDKPCASVSNNEEEYNMKEIKKGAKGQIVKVWQAVCGADVDGSFGPATEKATKNLQKKLNLPQTGVVDKATWKAGLESV